MKNPERDKSEAALDKIEAMWDRTLAKGDEIYRGELSTRKDAAKDRSGQVDTPSRRRRKGKSI